jgi:hypothetical protein
VTADAAEQGRALGSVTRAILLGAVASGVVAVLGVEVLSLERAIRPLPAWLLLATAVAAGVVAGRREMPRGGEKEARSPGATVAIDFTIATIGVVTLAVALIAAPNTWDSMTYHLARVAHWAANASVAHYPTSIDRQLWQPPFAEYLVLLGYVAVGSDRLANLPAWLAAAGSIVAAVEIARLLGRSPWERRLTALAVATVPGLILEATSTQTDVVAAFWVATTAALALAELVAPTGSWRAFAWIGAALGLAVGTKGTALPFGLPWIVVALAPALRARRIGTALRGLGVVTGAVLVLDAGLWLRNLLVFNGPLGPSNVQALLRPAGLDPRMVATNLLANLAIHAGTPWPAVNDGLTRAVTAVHRVLGLDVGVLYPYFGGYRVDVWNTHENVAGNPVHLVLAGLGAVLVARAWRARPTVERAFVAALAASVLLFAATVRWQPFNARLHLPLFVLLGPCLAMMLARGGRVATALGAGALVVASLPPLFVNATRPVVVPRWPPAMTGVESVFVAPRLEQYFASRRDVLPTYRHLATAIHAFGCSTVAVKTGYDGWEYPLWIVLGAERLEHVFVVNASTEIGETALAPGACVVVVDARPGWQPPDVPRPLTVAWAEGSAAILR